MIFKILMPFGVLLVLLIFIPLFFFNWWGLCIGAFISCLILLFAAKQYALLPLPFIKKFEKGDTKEKTEEYSEREDEFYNMMENRVNNRINTIYQSVHTESSLVLEHIIPMIKNKNEGEGKKIKVELITVGGMSMLKEELKKLDEVIKLKVMDFLKKDYLKIFVIDKKDQKHFSVTDNIDVLAQEFHEKNMPKDMNYSEDNVYLGKRYSDLFVQLRQISKPISQYEIKRLVGGTIE